MFGFRFGFRVESSVQRFENRVGIAVFQKHAQHIIGRFTAESTFGRAEAETGVIKVQRNWRKRRRVDRYWSVTVTRNRSWWWTLRDTLRMWKRRILWLLWRHAWTCGCNHVRRLLLLLLRRHSLIPLLRRRSSSRMELI